MFDRVGLKEYESVGYMKWNVKRGRKEVNMGDRGEDEVKEVMLLFCLGVFEF